LIKAVKAAFSGQLPKTERFPKIKVCNPYATLYTAGAAARFSPSKKIVVVLIFVFC
jgi:hypothetical protein